MRLLAIMLPAAAIDINPLVVALALLVLVVLAPVLDSLTGRGFGLSIASLLLIASTILVAAVFILAEQQPQQQNQQIAHPYGGAILIFAFMVLAFGISAVLTLLLMIGADIMASIAGHRRWLVALIVSSLVPVLVIGLPILYSNLAGSAVVVEPTGRFDLLSFIFQPALATVLVIPQATVLVYGIARIVHPVNPTRARQPAPPLDSAMSGA